ncbi:hypothetical protein B0H13DRAFT_1595801, partial [Mycena leptocephala]
DTTGAQAPDRQGALYQVALELDGDARPGQWDAVSACHLHQATTETLILHATHSGRPYALDYFVAPTPHNGACPKKLKASTPLLSFASNIASLNTTVEVRLPRLPPLPELRVPPPLTPEGDPVVPVPENPSSQILGRQSTSCEYSATTELSCRRCI